MSSTDILLSSASEHWCTPPEFLDLVRQIDSIGLDPCSNIFSSVGAKKSVTLPEDGLTLSWQGHGLVFVNPPYGRELPKWISKCVMEAIQGTEVIALTPARTDTRWFQGTTESIWNTASAVCFVQGRIKFVDGRTGQQTNPATFPSLVTYWGPRPSVFKRVFQPVGAVVIL